VLHAEHVPMSSGTGISRPFNTSLRADVPPFLAMYRSGSKIQVPLSHPMACVVLEFRFRSFVTSHGLLFFHGIHHVFHLRYMP
jgi:hypothetical protein